MAIGDPLNFDKSVTVGVISGKGRYAGLSRATSAFENLIQTDAAINFGNSGGPLVNVSGEVVGINTAISRFAQNIGFAVPVNVAKRLLPQLKKGKVVRGFLGVEHRVRSNKKWQEAYDLKAPEGALVQSVEKGKPADKAGLKHGDVITRVDDVAVKNNRDLIDYVSSKAPGAKISIALPARRQGADRRSRRSRRGPRTARSRPSPTRRRARPPARRCSASRSTTSRRARAGPTASARTRRRASSSRTSSPCRRRPTRTSRKATSSSR